jgi:hypothetical protein
MGLKRLSGSSPSFALKSFAAANCLSRSVCSWRADRRSRKTASISLSFAVNALQHSERIRSSNRLSMGVAVAQVSPYRITVRYKLGQRTEPKGQSRQRGVIEMREPAIVVFAINKRSQRGQCLLGLHGRKRQVDACCVSCPVSMSETGDIPGILYPTSSHLFQNDWTKLQARL